MKTFKLEASGRTKWLRLVTLLATGLPLVLLPARARADSFFSNIAIIDQANQYPGGGDNSGLLSTGTEFGQEFIPTYSSLSVVELQLEGPGTFTVNIRPASFGETGISGVSLGSASLTFTDNGTSFREFDFNTPVLLTPGDLYFIDATTTSLGLSTSITYLNQYAAGRAYYNGVFHPGDNQFAATDLRFVEGPLTSQSSGTPEPASWLLCGCGLAMLYRTRSRRSGSSPRGC